MQRKLYQASLLSLFLCLGTISALSQAQESRDGGPPNLDSTFRAANDANAKRLAGLSPVTAAMLQHPSDGDWLAWRRGNDALGFSPLAGINAQNAHTLGLAWSWALPASPNEITPLAHDGVLYIASGNSIQAMDGATGNLLWGYSRKLPEALHEGESSIVKNIAIYQNLIFSPTPDGHVVALNAKNGEVVLDRMVLGDAEQAAHLVMDGGPVIARGKVIQGVSNCATYKGGCFIVALEAETGNEAWRFHTIARPGEPGGDSWNGAPVHERFGGSVWTTGSYDPELNLLYYGVGQTYDAATLLQRRSPVGESADALYTDSTLAINPDTGKLVWYYQHFQRDTWDFDWVFEQSLIDLPVHGKMRKLLVTGGKIGIFDVIDRTDGSYISSQDLGLQSLVSSINPQTGRKRVKPELEPEPFKTKTICPHSGGARSWPATAIDPGSHILYIPLEEACMDFTWKPENAEKTAQGGKDIFWVLKPRPDSDGNFGRVEALNIDTGKVVWIKRHRAAELSSLLVTAGGLIFDGDADRRFRASDSSNGNVLWETRLNAVPSSTPISYMSGGKQYIAVVSGGGGGHAETWGSLTPEIKFSTNGISIWVFSAAP